MITPQIVQRALGYLIGGFVWEAEVKEPRSQISKDLFTHHLDTHEYMLLKD